MPVYRVTFAVDVPPITVGAVHAQDLAEAIARAYDIAVRAMRATPPEVALGAVRDVEEDTP